MRVALVQVASPDEEPRADRLERVVTQLRRIRDADLIVLPELWPVGFNAFDAYDESAETLDGPTITALAEMARELGCHLHAGSIIERTPTGSLRNTAVLLDPRGEVTHSYSKVHVFGYQSREATLLEPGDQLSVVTTPFGAVAGTTCYDLRFPELWRGIVDLGGQLVIVPAAWPAARLAHWQLFTTARAVENQVFVIACNAAGVQAGVAQGGHSRVVDPWGRVLVEADENAGITYCELDPGLVNEVRTEFPVLADRLPSYQPLLGQRAKTPLAATTLTERSHP